MENNSAPTQPSSPVESSAAGAEVAPKVPEIPEWQKMKHKIPVDGGEMEIDYKDLVKMASKASGADKRFNEAAQMRKTVENFLDGIQTNPNAAIRELGADKFFKQNPKAVLDLLGADTFKQLAEDVLWEQIQYEQMTPEQRELKELRQRDKQRSDEEKQRAESEKKTRFDSQVKHFEDGFNQIIDQTLAISKLPRTPYNVKRVASKIEEAIANDSPIDPEDFSSSLKGQINEEFGTLYGGLSGEDLFAILGEENAKKLREFDLGRLKTPSGVKRRSEGDASRSPNQERRTTKDFFAEIRKRELGTA